MFGWFSRWWTRRKARRAVKKLDERIYGGARSGRISSSRASFSNPPRYDSGGDYPEISAAMSMTDFGGSDSGGGDCGGGGDSGGGDCGGGGD